MQWQQLQFTQQWVEGRVGGLWGWCGIEGERIGWSCNLLKGGGSVFRATKKTICKLHKYLGQQGSK